MSDTALTRKVADAYIQAELTRVCTLREDRFGRAFGMQTVKVTPKWQSYRSDRSELPAEDYYHFRDNGSSVLAVAHLDTVVSQAGRIPHYRSTKSSGPYIRSGALDDRLGAYVILQLLPKLGINCDWLLTVGEESGASTAEFFKQARQYDWAIEFDRGGTDVVMYQYEDRASVRRVEAAGAPVGWGSFSDIAYLEQLGVKAFNWGVGYGGNYHSEDGYAFLNDTFMMVGKYLRFHEQNAGTIMPHEPERTKTYGYSPGSYRSYLGKYADDGFEYDWAVDHEADANPDNGDCDECMQRYAVDFTTGYCLNCGTCIDCGETEDDGCQCYLPQHIRDEIAGADAREETLQTRDWRQMTWDEYCELRPGKEDFDDVLCIRCSRHVARCECPFSDDPDSQPVKVPAGEVPDDGTPWSRLRSPWPAARTGNGDDTDVSHGLGFPTSQKIKYGKFGATLASRVRENRDYARKVLADAGWHEAVARGEDYLAAHKPGPGWASVCLRCSARWPHPITANQAENSLPTDRKMLTAALPDTDGGLPVHPEFDCPGCERCLCETRGVRMTTGAIHVIPVHLGSDGDPAAAVDNCPLCDAEVAASRVLSESDR